MIRGMLLTTNFMQNEAMSDWALGITLFIHMAVCLLAEYKTGPRGISSLLIQRQLLQSTVQLTKC